MFKHACLLNKMRHSIKPDLIITLARFYPQKYDFVYLLLKIPLFSLQLCTQFADFPKQNQRFVKKIRSDAKHLFDICC